MGKLLKLSIWILALALAAALAAFLTLKFYFTPDRIRKLALEYAGKNLRREISLDAATLNLRGFSLKNLKIAEAGGFKNGEFLSAENFSILPDFKALLRKELQINSIRASGVTLYISQAGEDNYNFSDLLSSPQPGAARKQPTGGQTKPVQLGISDISIKNSSIIYTNSDRSMTVTLSGLDLSARSLTSAEMFPFEADFNLGLKSSYLTGEFPVYAKGRAALGGWDPKKGRAEIDKATLKAGKIYFEFKGSLANLVEPDAKISLRVKAFSSTDLKPYFPGVTARILLPALAADTAFKLTSRDIFFKKLDFKAGPALGTMKGRLAWNPVLDYSLAADIKCQTPELDTTEIARKFHSMPKNIKIPLADVSARLTLSPKKVRLLAASVAAKSLKASAAGDFTMVPALTASGSLNFSAGDLHDLGEMMPQLREYDLTGSASGDFNFSLAKDMDLRGQLSYSGVGAKVFDTRFSEMKGSAGLSKDLLKADAAGKMESSPVKAALTVKNYSTHPQVMLNSDLAALVLKPSATSGGTAAGTTGKKATADKHFSGKPFSFDLTGKTRLGAINHPNFKGGETTIKYDLKNLSTDLDGLSGSASFSVAGGELSNIQQFTNNSSMARIVLYPFTVLGKISRIVTAFKFPDFTNVKFTRIEGDYTFRDGVMNVEKSQLRADTVDADSSGSINLVNDTLNLKVITTPKAGVNLPVPLGVTIKGPFNNPSVKADVSSVLKQPVIRDTVQKLLKGFLK